MVPVCSRHCLACTISMMLLSFQSQNFDTADIQILSVFSTISSGTHQNTLKEIISQFQCIFKPTQNELNYLEETEKV